MKEENIDHLFEADWNLLDEINQYYESFNIEEAIQKLNDGSKEERAEFVEKSKYYVQKMDAMNEKHIAIIEVVLEMYGPVDKLKKKDRVKIKLLGDKLVRLKEVMRSVYTNIENTLESFEAEAMKVLNGKNILESKEEELSSLEDEEKTITEAETLIDKQTTKEGKDIGEK